VSSESSVEQASAETLAWRARSDCDGLVGRETDD
jgi:hypothetical protein